MRLGWRRYPATVILLLVITVVYGIQLAVAQSLKPAAGYGVVTSLPNWGYLVLAPWLHSTHEHVGWNVASLLVAGILVERRVDSQQFIWFAVGTAYATNFGPYLLGSGGLGLGFSGVTNALWADVALFNGWQYSETVAAEPPEWRKAGVHFGLMVLGMLLPFKAVLQVVGYLPRPEGIAVGSHFLGVMLGVAWFGTRYFAGRLKDNHDD